MNYHRKIDFVFIIGFMLIKHCVIYHDLSNVIGNELRLYFLFNVFRFVDMEIAQSYRIFQFPE